MHMYSGESRERQLEHAYETLSLMEEQCDELLVSCRQGMLGGQGCKAVILERSHILSLLHELTRLYNFGMPDREREEDRETEMWRSSWVYEFDFHLRDMGMILHFVMIAVLKPHSWEVFTGEAGVPGRRLSESE